MPNWPPDPNKRADNAPSQPASIQPSSPLNGQEWRLIETTLLASLTEQRRARRWRTFFKLLTFAFLLLFFLALARGCGNDASSSLDTSEPHLAVVELQGTISSDDPANAYDVDDALTRAFENPNAKAVALDINSPGGSPVQSDEIWQTMMDLRKEYPDKKLYAVIGDIGASGAYYIASAADEIYVNPSSLVGSIGVIMPSYNVKGLMDKVGVEDRTITAGAYKDILSLTRPMTDYEKKHVENVLANTHQHFINAVKQGRGTRLKSPEENKLFSGLFWTGEQSIALGLADKTGSITSLEKQLKLDHVVNYMPTDPLQLFMDRFAVKLGAGIGSSMSFDVLPKEAGNVQMR